MTDPKTWQMRVREQCAAAANEIARRAADTILANGRERIADAVITIRINPSRCATVEYDVECYPDGHE